MCGIAGIRRFNMDVEPITPEQIKALAHSLQHRGGDATGFALKSGKNVQVFKAPDIAWTVILSRAFNDWLEEHLSDATDTVLVHTRAATLGHPSKVVNNHPMYAGQAAAVHNGHIWNHADLFKDLKLDRKAETDSDIIRAIVDEEGMTPKAVRVLNRMRGACASAIVHPEFPSCLLLLRSGSPLVVARNGSQLIWASEKQAIHRAARQWEEWNGMWFKKSSEELAYNPMEKESAWLIDLERKQTPNKQTMWHEQFSSCSSYHAPNYATHDNYENKQRRLQSEAEREKEKEKPPKANIFEYNKDKKEEKKGADFSAVPGTQVVLEQAPSSLEGLTEVKCRNKGCGEVMALGAEEQKLQPWQLQCWKCKVLVGPKNNTVN